MISLQRQIFAKKGPRRDCHALGTELEAHKGPPMMSRGAAQQIVIRDLKSIDDLSQLKEVEKEVWGVTDEDAMPLTLAIASKAAGNIFIGAFDKDKDKDKLVGFAFGFLGREHGQTTIHSHMLAVLDAYRHLNLGLRLKQPQRALQLFQAGRGLRHLQGGFLRAGNLQSAASERHRPAVGALDTEFAAGARSAGPPVDGWVDE